MGIYEIYDEENDMTLGALIHYQKENQFIIELIDDVDEWNCPLLFSAYVKNNIYTISRDDSRKWVEERVIPSGRQNIQSILKRHKLPMYNEMDLLKISQGRCSLDELVIKPLDELPEYVQKRMEKNLEDCVPLKNGRIMCVFADKTVKKIDMHKLQDLKGIENVLKNQELFSSAVVATGGYVMTFNNSIDVPAARLHDIDDADCIDKEDLIEYMQHNLKDTGETCEALGCTRQNMAYYLSKGYIKPIKENVKGNMFLKGDILKLMW
ncbi:MAG: hypothetical protein K6B67_01030 [Lachnospiraceae bacterium]|nr:hypothetical protein [Lachnospiraceae bacterium]